MIEGIDDERVAAWLVANVDGLDRAVQLSSASAAAVRTSTFAVTDAGGRRFVLRRPPLGHVLATAHDMTREHRAISAMGPTPVPVPEMLGLCTDEAVNGAPFYVMTLVEGDVMDTPEKADLVEPGRSASDDRATSSRCSPRCTTLDIDEIGLGDFGRREGYVERQIARWSKQWAGSKTRELPVVDEVAAQLGNARARRSRASASSTATTASGTACTDLAAGRIVAVLDWELCTLGDPLADLGYLGVYWSDRRARAAAASTTRRRSAGSARSTTSSSATRSSARRDVSDVNFYVAFQLWRSAVIIEGVYARTSTARWATAAPTGEQLATFGNSTVELAERAHEALTTSDPATRDFHRPD